MGRNFNIIEKYFYKEKSPYKNKYTININFDKFPPMNTEGSFNVLCGRLLGLSYPDYLRMCRDIFEADIIGKGNLYPVPYFDNDESLQIILKLLNKKMELIMKVKNFQTSDEIKEQWRAEYVKEFDKEPEYTLNLKEEES